MEIAELRSILHIERCDFNELVLNRMFYLFVFRCKDLPLTVKYTSERLVARNFFQNLNCKSTKEY